MFVCHRKYVFIVLKHSYLTNYNLLDYETPFYAIYFLSLFIEIYRFLSTSINNCYIKH